MRLSIWDVYYVGDCVTCRLRSLLASMEVLEIIERLNVTLSREAHS